MLEIGHKLKQIREDKKVSQQEVAYYLKVSQKTYSNIEANKSSLSIIQLLKLGAFLDFNIIEFLKEQQFFFNKVNNLSHKENDNTLPKKLLEQYEYRIREKEQVIVLLREKITSLQIKSNEK